ncbi:MAG: hypothetical protein RRB13_01920 [bacterium]|nr:hypothetical protein [bacterium]
MGYKWLGLWLCLVGMPGLVEAQNWAYRGEAAFVSQGMVDQKTSDWQLRYLPQWELEGAGERAWAWDAQLAGYLYHQQTNAQALETEAELLRAWGRVFDPNTELRLGLQELSFGPAVLLRSLQWFDQKDPLDPTGFTKGVKGALLRVSTKENSTFWLWSLGGNQDLYALTPYASEKHRVEWGGRAQLSFEALEAGLTLHRRTLSLPGQESVPESRLALDAKADFTYLGAWVEGVGLTRAREGPSAQDERWGTLGMDTSINWLEGLLLTAEHYRKDTRSGGAAWNRSAQSNALMASLGFGLLDNYRISWFTTEEPQAQQARFDWQRSYDNLLWNLSVFKLNTNQDDARWGAGLVVQYNH